jgi:hypothetical protein
MSLELYVSVSFSSNETVFITHLLDNALRLTNVTVFVILSYGTRLYSGEFEDLSVIEDLKSMYPDVFFCSYDVPAKVDDPYVLHNSARMACVNMAFTLNSMRHSTRDVKPGFWMLMLDADEIPDSALLSEWLATGVKNDDKVFKLSNYWYYLDPRIVSTTWEDSILLVHSSLLNHRTLTHPRERDGVIEEYLATNPCGRVNRRVLHPSGVPMFHHYSWVRKNIAHLFRKVANWGHSKDRDWVSLLEAEVDRLVMQNIAPANDIVHGYKLSVLPKPVHENLPRVLL